MKAYLVGVFDYVFHVDSVFLDKKEAMAYVEENNQIPFDDCDELCIEEVELNPSSYDKKIVRFHGYADKDKEIRDFVINRLDRENMEELKDFTGQEIRFRSAKYADDVTYFSGIIDVTHCSNLSKCDEYIKDIITKKLLEL